MTTTMRDRLVGKRGAAGAHYHCPSCGSSLTAAQFGALPSMGELAPTNLADIIIEDAPRRLPWGMMALVGAAGVGGWWLWKNKG